MTLSLKVFDACLVAHNMRFCCCLGFYSPVAPNWKKQNKKLSCSVRVKNGYTGKISDLGSSVCWFCLDLICFSDFFSLKSMPGVMPVFYSGGHSIWVNVRCHYTCCSVDKNNNICMIGTVWSQLDNGFNCSRIFLFSSYFLFSFLFSF